jgi:hypothetical protein
VKDILKFLYSIYPGCCSQRFYAFQYLNKNESIKKKLIKFGLHHRELKNQITNKATQTKQSLLPLVLAYSYGQI